MSLELGSQVAHYRLERKLGSGGMGEVYLARDTRLDRLVAIKVLSAPADHQARRRLLREARAVAALDHPGICAVYEVSADAAAVDYIAMQYVEGETLAARLRRGRMRADEALNVSAQIADALVAAHRRGIIHRDLKPQNIILTPSGVPKLLDFGIATHAPNSPAAANAITTSQVTDPNAVVGTPAYMSPEQIRNESIDFRTDVFSLGAVLYECLTGRRAFSGGTTAETLGAVLHLDPAPVSTIVSDLGPAYDAVCARMLDKTPSERFQSAEEVLGAIRALTPSSRVSASGTAAIPAPRPARYPRLLVAGLAVIALGLAAYQFWPRGLPVAPAEAARYYDVGVGALREGAFATARAAFSEALKVFSNYPQALSRLAEAHIGLDDEKGAREAVLRVGPLVPNRSRLPKDDLLHLEAAEAAALRQYEKAVKAYQQLVDRRSQDAGRWLDLGRALEAAARLPAARDAYAQAVKVDARSAAAHLRLGILQARARDTQGLASLDEAIGLYRAVTNTEGEAEALLAKGRALRVVGRADEARTNLEDVLRKTSDPKFAAQRFGAEIELALLDYVAGSFAAAEERAARAVEDAKRAGLPTIAARGNITVGVALMTSNPAAADAHLAEAIALANLHSSTRIEMWARLQQASLRLLTSHPDQAASLAEAPEAYFTAAGETRMVADAKLIKARSYEDLDRLNEAAAVTTELVQLAEQSNDDPLLAGALENLASQLSKNGRLPEALAQRVRLEDLHRRLKDVASLPKDLTNRAELLVLLGRGRDAEAVLRDVEERIAKGEVPYVQRRASVALLRALLATTDRRWADVSVAVDAALAALPKPATGKPGPPNYTQLFGRVLREHALAQMGQSRMPAAVLAKWPSETTRPVDRREFSYWVAATLLARGDTDPAIQVAGAALGDPAVKTNDELAWRLAAVQAESARRKPAADGSASISPQAKTSVERLKAAWAGAAATYLSRPDLAVILKTVR